MKLIDILVQELPKRGGWPEGASIISMHADGDIYINKKRVTFGFPLPQCDDGWCESKHSVLYTNEVTREQYEAALKQSVWDGTDAPPVGVECEYTLTGRTWFKCKVEMYVGSQGVVMSCDVFEGIQYVHKQDYPDLAFRPIRSERDEALEQMRKVVTNYNKTDVIHAIEQLYDAGYRKQ